jgi:hypothetical protein
MNTIHYEPEHQKALEYLNWLHSLQQQPQEQPQQTEAEAHGEYMRMLPPVRATTAPARSPARKPLKAKGVKIKTEEERANERAAEADARRLKIAERKKAMADKAAAEKAEKDSKIKMKIPVAQTPEQKLVVAAMKKLGGSTNYLQIKKNMQEKLGRPLSQEEKDCVTDILKMPRITSSVSTSKSEKANFGATRKVRKVSGSTSWHMELTSHVPDAGLRVRRNADPEAEHVATLIWGHGALVEVSEVKGDWVKICPSIYDNRLKQSPDFKTHDQVSGLLV